MTTTVVPDSIEPYIGYKALATQDGHLFSPSQFARWPWRGPITSQCAKTNQYLEWKLVPIPAPGWEERFWVPASVLHEGRTTKVGWPAEEPPEGMTWVPDTSIHHLEHCSCGIYAVDTVQQTKDYLRGADRVLCKVAMWGEVVIGSKGARGQFAYPQYIWAAEQQSQLVEDLSDNYGVTVEIIRFMRPEFIKRET